MCSANFAIKTFVKLIMIYLDKFTIVLAKYLQMCSQLLNGRLHRLCLCINRIKGVKTTDQVPKQHRNCRAIGNANIFFFFSSFLCAVQLILDFSFFPKFLKDSLNDCQTFNKSLCLIFLDILIWMNLEFPFLDVIFFIIVFIS